MEDNERFVKQLDVLINGEGGAAKQASLCDIVSQLKNDWPTMKAAAVYFMNLSDAAQLYIDALVTASSLEIMRMAKREYEALKNQIK